jgi:hypothetical protein
MKAVLLFVLVVVAVYAHTSLSHQLFLHTVFLVFFFLSSPHFSVCVCFDLTGTPFCRVLRTLLLCSSNDSNAQIYGLKNTEAVTVPGNAANYISWAPNTVPISGNGIAGFEFEFYAQASNDVHVIFSCSKERRPRNGIEVVLGMSNEGVSHPQAWFCHDGSV